MATGYLLPAVLLSGASPQPNMEMEMLSSMLSQITNDLSRMPVVMASASPANPCQQDQLRFRCSSIACLRQAADDLSPMCASFLLGAPEPSPAPEPVAISVRRPAAVFAAPPAEPLLPPAIAAALPPEIRELFGGMMRPSLREPMTVSGSMVAGGMGAPVSLVMEMHASDTAADDEDEESPFELSHHPCGREMDLCMQETGATTRDALQGCLLAHIDHLSTSCKCFVHQTMSRQAPAPAVAAAAVTRPSVAPLRPLPVAPEHPLHRLSCLFLFTAFLLTTFLLTRALLAALCGPARRPRSIAMVPPGGLTMKHVKSSQSRPVQVAEPLSSTA